MKKISSEIKFFNDIFKIKIGTIDKKNPQTVYIKIDAYLTPVEKKDSYAEDFENLHKVSKQYIKKMLSNTQDFSHNFIFVDSISTERIKFGKKSDINMQLYLKPSDELLKSKSFKNISDNINKNCECNFIPFIKQYINEIGYFISKTKK